METLIQQIQSCHSCHYETVEVVDLGNWVHYFQLGNRGWGLYLVCGDIVAGKTTWGRCE